MSACLEHVRECWKDSIRGNHDYNVFGDSVTVVSARPGEVKCVMDIEERHLNGLGNVHGGVIMTLVDDVTWLALQTFGTPVTHTVSSNLSADFTRPSGRLGQKLHMTAEAVKQGRRLAFVRITFYQGGEISAYGSQTFAVAPDQAEMTAHFSEDGSRLIPGKPPKANKAKL